MTVTNIMIIIMIIKKEIVQIYNLATPFLTIITTTTTITLMAQTKFED